MSEQNTRISATIAVTLSSFITSLMVSSLNVALPAIQEEFSIHAVTLTWVTTSYILSNAVFLIIVGKIADIVGRKRIFLLGIGVFAVSTGLAGFCGSITPLLTCRVLQGIGSAMVNGTAMAIISSVYPPHKRGLAIGIGTASIYIGLSLGPFLGGVLTAALGWRSIFFVVAPLEAGVFLLTLLSVKGEWADAKGEPYDFLGSVLYAVSLTLFMYGATLLPKLKALFALIPGLTGLLLFTIHELRVRYPLFDVSLFRNNRVFAFSSIAALINYAATYSISFLLSLFLQISLNLSPQLTGIILATQPVVQAVLSPVTGRISDRVEPAILVSTGMGVTAVGLFLLSFLSAESSVLHVVLVLFLMGSGYSFFASPNTNAIMRSVEKKHYGLASGTLATMRSLGMVFSMCVTSIVFSLFIGERKIGTETILEFNRSVRVSFLVFTAFCAVGIYFSAVRGNLDRDINASQED